MDNQIVKRTVIYEGLFDNRVFYSEEDNMRVASQIDDYRLENPIARPHITVAYKPEVVHNNLYGANAYAILRGYGNDGNNEGYSVELVQDCRMRTKDYQKEFSELISSIEKPHITISVSSEGTPLDTKYLEFKALPFERVEILPVRFGAYIRIDYDDGNWDTKYVFLPNE